VLGLDEDALSVELVTVSGGDGGEVEWRGGVRKFLTALS
jgi:hypothetical protein